MTDHDFACADHGTVATITTNNWATTQWLRENARDVDGTVTGGNYATVTGEPKCMLDMALGLIDAGFTCADHQLIEPRGTA